MGQTTSLHFPLVFTAIAFKNIEKEQRKQNEDLQSTIPLKVNAALAEVCTL